MAEQVLVVVLFVLLLGITGGVVYLTFNEFRDWRRRKKKTLLPITPPPKLPKTGKKRRR